MDENELLIASFKYNRRLAMKFSKEILFVVDRHAAMFVDQKDFSILSIDAAWDMVCREACWSKELKAEVESFLILSGTYIIDMKMDTMEIMSLAQDMKEIEIMASQAMC